MSDVTAETPGDAAEPVEGERGGFGSLGSIIYLLAITWAAGIASFPLNDNSFFTHLATGRLILERGSVPSTDPYTFTAYGEPWTVQSWLASAAYAGVEQVAGDLGLRVLVLGVFVAAMTVLWKLTAPAKSVAVRFALLAGALFVVTDLWSERPYMVGVVGLGLVWLVTEDRARPVLLVPYMWLWVNSHGSWPLAVVLVAAIVAGASLDRRMDDGTWTTTRAERATATMLLIGVPLGAIGPLGLKALAFPFTALTNSETFGEIVEWRSPAYESIPERAYLVFVVVTLLLLVRRGSWRLAVPAVAFAAAGLLAQRNIVMATVVLIAACAHATPKLGSLVAADRPKIGPLLAGAVSAVAIAVAALALASPVLTAESLGGYPARPLAMVSLGDLPQRHVAADVSTGNLLEVLDVAPGSVFVDDRVDMFPTVVFRDSLTLGRGGPGWAQALDRYDIDAVLWSADAPVASLLRIHPGWRVIYSDPEWVLACRRGASCPVEIS